MKNRYFSDKLSSLHGKHSLLLFGSLLFLYFLPLVINGQDSYITIRDNLDGELVLRVVLSRNNSVSVESGIEVVPQIMGGVPRSSMTSDLNIIMFLFRILNPFQAYLLNFILVHTIAFIGMYLFINSYLLFDQDPPPNSNILSLAVSFTFAILPFYTMHGLSVAGLPLLLFAFLNIA